MAIEISYPQRKNLRLQEYDYSQPGAYFVTVVTLERKCLFGEIRDGKIILNPAGRIIKSAWLDLPNHYRFVRLDQFCVMPNHFHGILWIVDDSGRGGSVLGNGPRPDPEEAGKALESRNPETRPPVGQKANGLSEVIRAFKSFSARRMNALSRTSGTPIWQRNFYEHVIRDENDLQNTRRYILENPIVWEMDEERPR